MSLLRPRTAWRAAMGLLLALCACLAPAAERALVVGSEQDYPPFATGMTDETAGGFTVELWKAVAAEAGLAYTIRVHSFRQVLEEFKGGKVDVLINLARSEERAKFADFTVPHVVVHGAIFVRDGTRAIQSEADLGGKSIIVLNADMAHDYAVARGWARQLVLVETSAEGMRLLASGKHDAMLLSRLAGVQTLKATGIRNVRPIQAHAGFAQKFTFAVHKGQPELLARINEGLSVVKSNGTYDALYEKWFGVYELKDPGVRDVLAYVVPVVAFFIVLAAVFFYRRRREREAAERKYRDLLERTESQKLAAIGQLTGGLAHDFNNLLGVVVGNLDFLGEKLPGDKHHKAALDAALRGAEVTRSLLAVARRQPLEVEVHDLNALVAEMVPLLVSSAGSPALLVASLHPEPLPARLDAGGLSNVVLNLVINARDALDGRQGEKRITLTTSRQGVSEPIHGLAPGAYAVLEVADTGPGMSEAVRAQAFEPFFTTKERGHGTGLGLAMVFGYAQQLGGTATIDSTEGTGTHVRVWLPLDESPSGAAAAAVAKAVAPATRSVRAPDPAARPPRVLVVDDEPGLRELACTWLRSFGFDVVEVESADAALACLGAGAYDAMFTDVVMPGTLDGIGLAHEAQRRCPELRILLTSGYSEGLLAQPDLPWVLLKKPYRKADLAAAFDTLLPGQRGGA